MTEYRLRVTFWNVSPGGFTPVPDGTTIDAKRSQLSDEFTDWTADGMACQALGEKLIRDGAWVTKSRHVAKDCDHTRDCDCLPVRISDETFLVPPARIREVSIETREVQSIAFKADAFKLVMDNPSLSPTEHVSAFDRMLADADQRQREDMSRG